MKPVAAFCLLLPLALSTAGCDKKPNTSPPSTTAAEPEKENVAVNSPFFIDKASSLGVDFVLQSGTTGKYFFPEIVIGGAALFDFDNDGDLDLYLLQGFTLSEDVSLDDASNDNRATGLTNRLYRNDLIPSGTMGFTDVSEDSGLDDPGYSMGVAIADTDNDGDSDVLLTQYGLDKLFRNNGDGTFTDVSMKSDFTESRWTTSASFFDYDLDGDLDLYSTFYVAFNHQQAVECWYSGGTGAREYCGPLSVTAESDRLWRNDGDNHFVDVSEQSGVSNTVGTGLGTSAVDFDEDGYPDLYVANDQQANRLWLNLSNGRFEDTAIMSGSAYNYAGAPEASMGLTAGDFDNDGDEDLFMTHLDGQTNTLLVNAGNGNFIDRTDSLNLGAVSLRLTGFGTRFLDYDNDGWLDLFSANGAVIAKQGVSKLLAYSQPNQLFRNNKGRFVDVSKQAGNDVTALTVSRGAAFGDIDNDGDTDIVVVNKDQKVQVLFNQTGSNNHWLRLRLTGTTSNRDAIGARVAVLQAGKPKLWRRVHTDGSYLSASDVRVLIGLGDKPAIDGVGVYWPSGRTEQWDVTKIDTDLNLTEGEGSNWTP
ncbi:MAG: CRTAC1 family protein [Gammaproteobacteria bacterium]